MIELETIMVLYEFMNLFLCCVYHGQIIYRVYVNLLSYSSLLYGEKHKVIVQNIVNVCIL